MKIPSDVYETVLLMSHDLVTAAAIEDKQQEWRLYNELREYAESVAASGQDHPFLWETVADFTSNDAAAIEIYLRALALAKELHATDYLASICFALAERYSVLAAPETAYAFCEEANHYAKQTDDLALRRQISEFPLEQAHSDETFSHK
ncbi:hypothetical protein HR45_12080 [Shewanella mangrovi]|uniref:Replicative DNA helicase n=1 Tax=Shewanella mangrovi TaxID=1515746 RepID=A0A094JGI9_9GAMM|nr:hypothetical protein [Shewanella mangrovi]KFZ37144.1 hypothetical protein HR45_12080 [Shewanella mangrovi]